MLFIYLIHSTLLFILFLSSSSSSSLLSFPPLSPFIPSLLHFSREEVVSQIGHLPIANRTRQSEKFDSFFLYLSIYLYFNLSIFYLYISYLFSPSYLSIICSIYVLYIHIYPSIHRSFFIPLLLSTHPLFPLSLPSPPPPPLPPPLLHSIYHYITIYYEF